MDYLAQQIQGNGSVVRTASKLIKDESGQERVSPYVGIVSMRDTNFISQGLNNRKVCQLGLYIITKQQDTSINAIGEYIEGIVNTINLGSNVFRTRVLGGGVVVLPDYTDASGDKYSQNRMDVEVIYTSSSSNLVIYDPAKTTGGLTEPFAKAHYKVFALLSSGSYSCQPHGTLVYSSNLLAAVKIPTGSGSLMVGVVNDPEVPQSVYAGEDINQHSMVIAVDIATSYSEDSKALFPTLPLIDNVVNKLLTNIDLGDEYRIYTAIAQQGVDQLFESKLYGARILCTVRRFYGYTQE